MEGQRTHDHPPQGGVSCRCEPEETTLPLAVRRMTHDHLFYTKQWLLDVEAEMSRARIGHPTNFHSPHEGYAVLLEEVRELEAEVFRNAKYSRIRDELLQIAAMAQRMAEDLKL